MTFRAMKRVQLNNPSFDELTDGSRLHFTNPLCAIGRYRYRRYDSERLRRHLALAPRECLLKLCQSFFTIHYVRLHHARLTRKGVVSWITFLCKLVASSRKTKWRRCHAKLRLILIAGLFFDFLFKLRSAWDRHILWRQTAPNDSQASQMTNLLA